MKVKISRFTYPDTQQFCWRLEYRKIEAVIEDSPSGGRRVQDRIWWTLHRDYIRKHDALRGARALARKLGEDPSTLEVEWV